jgi:hypothetical protein
MKKLNFGEMEKLQGGGCGWEGLGAILSGIGIIASAGTGGVATGIAVGDFLVSYASYFDCKLKQMPPSGISIDNSGGYFPNASYLPTKSVY